MGSSKTDTNNRYLSLVTALGMVAVCCSFGTSAQTCPANIDFESGTFNNWVCYTGSVAAVGGQNVISLSPSSGPVTNRHTMYSGSGGNDFFGGFPVKCPNGSAHSIKLGNNQGGGQAEGVSYEFTIPANQNSYTLKYHYAVVFQDPHHQQYQQPRLEIEAKNITDNEVIYCSSFTFYPFGSLLPGFYVSPYKQATTEVWCKDWSEVSINLDSNAGKTIRLFFKTADCTFSQHFGYAYIDVDTECSSGFIGASFCPNDTVVTVTAPSGYEGYTWYNNNFTQVLGTEQTISIKPPPPSGTMIAVELMPYPGYGCATSLNVILTNDLTIVADAGKDVISCNKEPVQIGANPVAGLVYNWSPAADLSNPYIANPRAGPAATSQYVLTARSRGGGCIETDTVTVIASFVDTSLGLIGKPAFCITSGDSAVLLVQPQTAVQWYRNNNPINGAAGVRYKATQSGTYHARLINHLGCSLITAGKDILIELPKPGIRYPVVNAAVNSPTQLQARAIGKTALWNPFTYLNNPAAHNPVFKGLSEKMYTIKLTTGSGCITIDTQRVKVYKDINFYVPNAFTPNGDGLNDYLYPVAAGFKELSYFRVYNRWGQLLFDLKWNDMGWDGNFKGLPQQTQTVVWMAEGITAEGTAYRQKGTSILLR